MSKTQPITQKITGEWIKCIGRILDFEHTTISYTPRYSARNSLDQSGMSLFCCQHWLQSICLNEKQLSSGKTYDAEDSLV